MHNSLISVSAYWGLVCAVYVCTRFSDIVFVLTQKFKRNPQIIANKIPKKFGIYTFAVLYLYKSDVGMFHNRILGLGKIYKIYFGVDNLYVLAHVSLIASAAVGSKQTDHCH